MPEEGVHTISPPLTEAERARGQTYLIRVALTDTFIYTVVAGNMATLYVLRMGGTSYQASLRQTFSNFAPVLQLLGLALIVRMGKARLGALGRWLNIVPMLLLIALGAYAHTGGGWAWCAVICFAALSVTNTIGNTGWWPILQDNTEGVGVGAFFSRMRLKLRILEVGLPLIVGAVIGANPSTYHFIVPLILAISAMVYGSWHIRRVPERRFTPPDAGVFTRLRRALRVPSVRHYVQFVSLRSLIGGLPAAYWVIMLKAHGLTDNFIIWMIPVVAVGHVVGLNLWANVVDRHGSRPALTISIFGYAAVGLAWLAMPSGLAPVIAWSVLFYLAVGFFDGAYMMGRTQAIMDAIPAHCQADAFTLNNVAMALFAALGAYIGTVALDPMTVAPGAIAGVDFRLIYLAGVQLCTMGVWLASRRLTHYHRETPTSVLMDRVLEWFVG